MPYTVPSVPYGVTVHPGHGNVSVDWTAPNNGGNAIQHYEIDYLPVGGEISGNAYLLNTSSFTISGLNDNASYSFTVKAENAAGFGATSSAVVARTFGLPWTTVVASPATNDSVVHLSWATTTNGGTPVTGYKIYRAESAGSEVFLADAGTGLSYDDATAINGHTYYYRVVAVNIVGAGSSSTEVSVTPARAPGAPTGLGVTGEVLAMHLAWTAPADMGGGVQHYLIYRGSTSGSESLIDTIGNVTSYDSTRIARGRILLQCRRTELGRDRTGVRRGL